MQNMRRTWHWSYQVHPYYPHRTVKWKPLIIPCSRSFTRWYTRNLKDGQISYSSCFGLIKPRRRFPSTYATPLFLMYGPWQWFRQGKSPFSSFGARKSALRLSRSYCYIKALEEMRHNEENKWLTYQKQTSKAYNKMVRPRNLCMGDLMLKATWHI